uniref:uromodulin-like isoform X2 n=1 Tax=Styela clava TaxID=7725 RepID=UPI00193A4385|nr:uromodulin-like isoform X2 [Styela clava]
MVEDHPKQTITVDGSTITTSNVLSKIPLQFIIDISSAASCNINPTYPPYSIQDGETFVISDTETFNETLYAYPSGSGGSITQFVVIGPLGLHQSEITDHGNDLFSSNMIWDATSDQSGDHTVCYYAVDSKGLHSEQRCFTITVTAFSTVECDGLTTNISIANCASEEVIFAGEHNNLSSECQSTRGTSQQHLSLTSGQCGMTTESSAAGIQYATVIFVYKEDTAGSSSVITRGEWVQISVVCTLPASSNLTGSFVPEVPITGDNVQNEVSIEGMGTFVFSFDIYRTESFTTAYSPAEYPVEVSIDDDIYFALQAVGRGDLTLFTEECVALSTETITPTTLEYPFISAGCLEDPTIEKYSSDNPLENRFSIQAFQFADTLLASKEDAAVYIQCSVLLCDLSNTTRCYQGCVSSTFRDKRSILQHDSIVRANLAKNDSDNQDVEDDDDDEIPLTTKESSPQTISNALVLIFDDDGGNDNDGGNGSKRKAVTTAWIAFLLGVIIFHRLE